MARGDIAVCRHCKKEFIQGRNTFGIYCSIKCQQDYQWEQRKQLILVEGRVPNSKTGRRFLLERDGNVCQFPGCGCREWNGKPVPLILDHIDGNPNNWTLVNLRLICPNCDGLTDTYKNRNRGNGRHAQKTGGILSTHPRPKNAAIYKGSLKSSTDVSSAQTEALQQLERQLAQLKEKLDRQFQEAANSSSAG